MVREAFVSPPSGSSLSSPHDVRANDIVANRATKSSERYFFIAEKFVALSGSVGRLVVIR